MAKASHQFTDQTESIAGYFRPIFEANHKLLGERSNAELFDMWLKDHPQYTSVPKNVASGLGNLKSILRKKYKIKARKSGKPKASGELLSTSAGQAVVKMPRAARHTLERLEEKIDECMSFARSLDPERLDEVIRMLRVARNEVIYMSAPR